VYKRFRFALLSAVCICFIATTSFAASPKQQKLNAEGTIVQYEEHVVQVKENGGNVQSFKVTDQTQITRHLGFLKGSSKPGDAALVPGLTVKVKGVATSEGAPEAKKITFKADAFAVTVAQQQAIKENQKATAHAQTTADDGVAASTNAQASADHAQASADQGIASAQAANVLGGENKAGVRNLNQRVTELGDYNTLAEAGVYFTPGSSTLSASARKDLDQLVAANSSVNGYVVEITGYASKEGGARYNQKLSEARAATVAEYLLIHGNVPAARLAVPAGYGATHPAAANDNAKDRALNRRVEVRILVAKGLQEGANNQTASVSDNH